MNITRTRKEAGKGKEGRGSDVKTEAQLRDTKKQEISRNCLYFACICTIHIPHETTKARLTEADGVYCEKGQDRDENKCTGNICTYRIALPLISNFILNMPLDAVFLDPITICQCVSMSTCYAIILPIGTIAIHPLNREKPLPIRTWMCSS